LIVPLPDDRKSCTLKDCLKKFNCHEDINDVYDCEVCKVKTSAVRTMNLWTVPDRLIINIKRFVNDGNRTAKATTFVDYPITGLTLGEYMSEYKKSTDKYDLYGVVNHSGSKNGGHYTAHTKNPINDRWYEFNDSNIVHVNSEDIQREIITDAAYILFYKKVV